MIHFAYFGHPKETVFDEVHFGKFVSGYFTREYFFDIHPPLGKLIISGAAKVAGFQPGFSFEQIGEKIPEASLRAIEAMRFLPAVAGTLLPLIIFLLCLELGFSKIMSFAGGLLIAFENSLLVQTRLILLDGFLLLFGFLSWYLYARYKNKGSVGLFYASVLVAGLAFSVKWTGVTFLGVILILESISFIRNRTRITFSRILYGVLLSASLYFSIFIVHLNILNKTGPGDAFMTPGFKKTLIGSLDYQNPDIKPLNSYQKFIELNWQMYDANARLTATHPYSTKRDCPPVIEGKDSAPCHQFFWYTWPLMVRPIYYWNESVNRPGTSSRIYFLGNPVVWWGGTVGIVLLIVTIITNLFQKIKNDRLSWFILGAYFFNLLPFIGINRAMFLYHYLTAMIIGVIALIYGMDKLSGRKKIAIGVIGLALVSFIYFAPLSYGLPLSNTAFKERIWFSSWE